ncbi:MAG: DUF3365 domain-containing protein [Campylobacterales bacterium]|nr:DUF3365 domain-containing protein [Campylobacterales bacterium]
MKIKVATLIASLLLSSNLFANEQKKDNTEEIIKIGREVSDELFKVMGGELKKQLADNNFSKAGHFCSMNAMSMTADVNKKYGSNATVKRVSLKNRNPQNRPADEIEITVLEVYEKLNAQKIELPEIVKKVDENRYKYFKPIKAGMDMCFKCHGDSKTLDKEAYSNIYKIYPEDKAINHKMGDVRGAFVIDIIKGAK